MKRLIFMLVVVFAFAANADAQGWLGKLKDKAVDAAKRTVENNVERKIERKVDDAMNGKSSKKGGKSSDDADYDDAEVGDDDPSAATTSDFKRGAVIMFQDDLEKEPVGEFPSKWDLISGSAEVKTLGGKKAIEVTDDGYITPLIEEQGAYLPEEFTIEYDFYYWNNKNVGLNDIKLVIANTKNRSERADEPARAAFILQHPIEGSNSCVFRYNNGTWEYYKDTGFEHTFKQGWHHVAISFNKRALKAYIDGKRVVNLPRVQQGTWFGFQVPYDYHDLTFIRNVVLAKGAVALYDRDAQSMTAVEKAIAETGKFVTNNILFETGKATLKPESMTEIQKVAAYMKKNPSVRFEVQGHTDNQGSDAVNDPLSQQRAEAVVKALEGLGCDGFNLRAVGKGSHEPVADNKTEAGRAKNRRVEFIKK